MSRIFISHSNRDNFTAVVVADWLKAEGWDDIFLDIDATEGIHPGERWERALYDHAAVCEAVLFLLSRNWLSSEWCRREHQLAHKLNKRIFIALIEEIPLDELPGYLTDAYQVVQLAAGRDHRVFHPKLPITHEEGNVTLSAEGLARLKAGLTQGGLDPRFFAWPPDNEPSRAPYRGLQPIDGVDAGIFFGREAQIIEALDALRGLRQAACPRLFVILGASGAGKSSFLRAGLLPRLARDERNFAVLPIVRPQRAALSGPEGFVAALAEASLARGLTITRAEIRDAVGHGAEALRSTLRKIAAERADYARPTLVVTVDQTEEMFRAEGRSEGESLLALLRELVTSDDPPVITIFGIRSDSYDDLAHARSLEALRQQLFPLLPMARGSYQAVIEGPARRLAQTGRKFHIDPRLTDALLHDIEKGGGADALPLVSLTLEQLYQDHHAAGVLSREDYEKFNGLGGAIKAALSRVFVEADKDATIPKDPEARLALLRQGFIPWLAGIDPETKMSRRRIARAAQIPPAARPIIDLLVEQRLLTRGFDEGVGEATIEPSHEALLRQWIDLERWLAEDIGNLATLEGLQRAARDWDGRARDTAWVSHTGARLEEAEAVVSRRDLAAMLTSLDRAYLSACRDKDKQVQRAKRDADERSALLAAHAASSLTMEGSLDAALLLLLDCAHLFDEHSVPDEIRIAFTRVLEKKARLETKVLFPNMVVFETDAALFLVDPATNDVWKLADSIDPLRLKVGTIYDRPIVAMSQSVKGDDVILVRENLQVERVNMNTGAGRMIGIFPAPQTYRGREYDNEGGRWLPAVEFIGNDLLIRQSLLSGYQDGLELNCQIMDSNTGRIVEGIIPSPAIVNGVSLDALSLYHKSGDAGKTFKLRISSSTFVLEDAGLPKDVDGLWRHIPCFEGLDEQHKIAIWEEIKDHAEFFDSKLICKRVGDSMFLITIFVTGSSGIWRDDRFITVEADAIRNIKIQGELSSLNPSNSDLTWVGVNPNPELSYWGASSIGALFNRDAVVRSSGSVKLQFRHPTPPTHARFIGHNCLVVIDAANGYLWAHDFGDRVRKDNTLFSRATNTLIGTEDPVPTLYHGTCVGRSIPRSGEDRLPDGRRIIFDVGTLTTANEKHEIRVVDGDDTMAIPVAEDAWCITVSPDWSRLLVARPSTFEIYDLGRVLGCRSLAEGELSTINWQNSSVRRCFTVSLPWASLLPTLATVYCCGSAGKGQNGSLERFFMGNIPSIMRRLTQRAHSC